MPLHNKLDTRKANAITALHRARPTRGRRQIMMQLEQQHGIHMCLGSVHRYMRIINLQSTRKRRYNLPKKETQNPFTFPNVLDRDFHAGACTPIKWVTDITYLPCKDGTLYLSCIKDLADKSIVAYHLSNKNDLRLVMDLLRKAESSCVKGIVLHSDQGSQYQSPVYRDFLTQHGLIGCMSRKASPLDNAPMESFFSILKNEELTLHKGLTTRSLPDVIHTFISYYNHDRLQLALHKMAPALYRRHFL